MYLYVKLTDRFIHLVVFTVLFEVISLPGTV